MKHKYRKKPIKAKKGVTIWFLRTFLGLMCDLGWKFYLCAMYSVAIQ